MVRRPQVDPRSVTFDRHIHHALDCQLRCQASFSLVLSGSSPATQTTFQPILPILPQFWIIGLSSGVDV